MQVNRYITPRDRSPAHTAPEDHLTSKKPRLSARAERELRSLEPFGWDPRKELYPVKLENMKMPAPVRTRSPTEALALVEPNSQQGSPDNAVPLAAVELAPPSPPRIMHDDGFCLDAANHVHTDIAGPSSAMPPVPPPAPSAPLPVVAASDDAPLALSVLSLRIRLLAVPAVMGERALMGQFLSVWSTLPKSIKKDQFLLLQAMAEEAATDVEAQEELLAFLKHTVEGARATAE